MAGEWQVVSTRRTTQVTSPTQVLDAMVIGVQTKPHNVYFERAVPYKDWIDAPVNAADFYAAAPAGNIEYLLTSGTAVACSYVEDLSPAGLVEGFIQVTVQIPSPSPSQPGPFYTDVLIPMSEISVGSLAGPVGFPEIDAAISALRATAGA